MKQALLDRIFRAVAARAAISATVKTFEVEQLCYLPLVLWRMCQCFDHVIKELSLPNLFVAESIYESG